MTSFADYKATQDARNTIELNIRKYALMLCDALEMNFKQRNRGELGGRPAPEYKFYIQEGGRKYHKIVMEYDNGSRNLFMPSLIKRLVMFSNQHHSKHLLKSHAIMCSGLNPVRKC